jgi:type I restriction enzyme S subunit
MENGKSAIAEELTNGISFRSTEFHVLRPGPKIIASWLHFIIRQKSFREEAMRHFKGTAGQRRVPESFLRDWAITLPPIREQILIVEYLENLKEKIHYLKELQAQTEIQLDSLLLSLIHEALNGKL